MKRSEILKEIQSMEKRLAVLKSEVVKIKQLSPTMTIDELEDKVCPILGISKEAIHSQLRMRDVVNARFIIFWILYNHGYTYSLIGCYYNRNHATVIHGVKLIDELLQIKDKTIEMLVSKVSHLTNLNKN